MPAPSVSALAEPIRAVLATVGPGWPPGSHPAESLAVVRDLAAAVAAQTAASWAVTGGGWTGAAADAAQETTGATMAALDALGQRASRLGAAAAGASVAVERARARLQRILDDFEALAASIDPDAAGAAKVLAAEADRALDEATAVVDELRAELDGHATAVADPGSAATVPASATPGGFDGSPGWGGTGAAPSGLGGGLGSGAGLDSGAGSPAGQSHWPTSAHDGGHGSAHSHGQDDARTPADPGVFGSGVSVALPDGSTATAPNAAAASAVRYALTQLGVPYCWGGTSPGVGLDCSGLTQWAYHEAGVDLPRLAQEQDVGAAVSQNAVRPGDLAVWDGHVAMIVGNGEMIEAGDPVHLSPIRTTNAGQGFQGFWRPTA